LPLPILRSDTPPGVLILLDGTEPPEAQPPAPPAPASFTGGPTQAFLLLPGAAGTAPRPEGKEPPITGPSAEAVAQLRLSLSPEGAKGAPDPSDLPFYDVHVVIDPEAGTLAGEEEITYPNRTGAALATLPIRIFANAGGEILAVLSASRGGVAIQPRAVEPSLIELPIDPPLVNGAWARLKLTFTGALPEPAAPDSSAGLAALLAPPTQAPDYGLFARFADGAALAEWLPMVAGRWQGDFDRQKPPGFGDVSYFDLSGFRVAVDLPAAYVLAAPGAILGEQLLPNGTRRTTLALADARDLALFASKSYRLTTATEGPVRLRSYCEKADAAAGASVLQTARTALAFYGQTFGPYPYSSFVIAEVPLRGGAGGAEFPGAIAVAGLVYGAESPLPGGAKLGPAFLKRMREFTVAHEVAHQWWAIAVASQPRAEPDVDEPLTQYSAALYVGRARGAEAQAEALDQQVAANYQAMRLLGLADGPAARETQAFESAGEYAGLVYGKAPFFFAALSARYSPGALTAGLARYAREHWFRLAVRGDLVGSLAAQGVGTRSELTALYQRYFLQAHGDEDLIGLGDPMSLAQAALGGQGLDLESLLNPKPFETSGPKFPADPPASERDYQTIEELQRALGGDSQEHGATAAP
jgi:hypothetical protein